MPIQNSNKVQIGSHHSLIYQYKCWYAHMSESTLNYTKHHICFINFILSMYTGAKTVVRTVYGNSNGFEVKVGMHQGSALSPLLFVMFMEALSREFRVALP